MARNIVSYKQNDSRWKDKPYTVDGDAHETVGYSGCGPTCAAMVVASWADKTVTPPDMCDYAIKTSTRTPNSGTAWEFFKKVADKYSLEFRQTDKNIDARSWVDSGGVVVCSMGPGRWTKGGHYVLWYDIAADGDIRVYDPISSASSRAKAPIADMYAQSKQYFCFRTKPHHAIARLAAAGKINSPDYWHDVIDGVRTASRENIGAMFTKWYGGTE